MVKGYHICKNEDCIENLKQKTGELRLIARGDGTEVMIQHINAGEIFFIEPGDQSELMEFFYIIEGEIIFVENNVKEKLKKGDYFYVQHLRSPIQFNVITKTTLMYLSTQPIFYHLSDIIEQLIEIAKKVEAKDKYTHSHIQRVRNYAVEIANKLQLSRDKIENIGFASLFHDIGKVYIPDEILKKPGSLCHEEMECIKKHPVYGIEMVKKTYYNNIGKIIEQHHERLDGSGYPKGLKADEIEIEAKIIAVADAYDAMTTDRPYRKALNPSVAIDELKSLIDIHYDREVVTTLENILKEEKVL